MTTMTSGSAFIEGEGLKFQIWTTPTPGFKGRGTRRWQHAHFRLTGRLKFPTGMIVRVYDRICLKTDVLLATVSHQAKQRSAVYFPWAGFMQKSAYLHCSRSALSRAPPLPPKARVKKRPKMLFRNSWRKQRQGVRCESISLSQQSSKNYKLNQRKSGKAHRPQEGSVRRCSSLSSMQGCMWSNWVPSTRVEHVWNLWPAAGIWREKQ